MRKVLAVLVLAILMVSAIGPGEGQEGEEGEIIVKETRITDDIEDQMEPLISHDNIVWMDYGPGYPKVFIYNINTKTIKNLLPSSLYQGFADIQDNYIVWIDAKCGKL